MTIRNQFIKQGNGPIDPHHKRKDQRKKRKYHQALFKNISIQMRHMTARFPAAMFPLFID